LHILTLCKEETADPTEEPAEEPEPTEEPEIYRYMQFRAGREGQAFILAPEWFTQRLEQGIRKMFKVQVTSEGEVISDPTHLEILTEWKAANPGTYAGKTGTRCLSCFEDFTEEFGRQRAEMRCTCTEELCRKCFTIHMTRTATQCGDQGCSNWHIECPTCSNELSYCQDFFHHCHQTCVANHWLG
jgi:hypothetical protein